MAQNINLGFRLNESPETLLKELVLSPLIYIRFVGLVCSIIVFGCISDKVQVSGSCLYHSSNACSFGVAVGVIAFLLCLLFLVRDVIYVVIDFRNNVMVKKAILIVDAAANGLWTFMWFVAFVYLADQWRKTPYKDTLPTANRNCANSGVAFSFFCMFIWAGIVAVNVFFFVRIMREGGGGGAGGGKGSGYASFPEGGSADDGSDREGGGPNYQPPEY